jgi:hypothetical protein
LTAAAGVFTRKSSVLERSIRDARSTDKAWGDSSGSAFASHKATAHVQGEQTLEIGTADAFAPYDHAFYFFAHEAEAAINGSSSP